jgi:hypothetical protein
MSDYHNFGVNLSKGQAKKIAIAHKKGSGTTIRLSKANLNGNIKIPLTQTQINKIRKAKTGVQLNLSESQLKHMETTGGFIPLLTLIPIIASALGAAGGVAGGVASAVSSAKANAEQARHNRAIEEQLKSGSGAVSNIVSKIPVIGNFLEPLLQKIGLGINSKNIKKLNSGKCVCCSGLQVKKVGNGLYLEPEHGEGLFLGRER